MKTMSCSYFGKKNQFDNKKSNSNVANIVTSDFWKVSSDAILAIASLKGHKIYQVFKIIWQHTHITSNISFLTNSQISTIYYHCYHKTLSNRSINRTIKQLSQFHLAIRKRYSAHHTFIMFNPEMFAHVREKQRQRLLNKYLKIIKNR